MGTKPEWPRTSPMVGERWVYRHREGDALTEVEVVRIGVRRPPRLLVRFVDDEFEGLQDWVPPARLKALWHDHDEYSAWEGRWRRLLADVPRHDAPELRAVSIVIDELLPPSSIEVGWNYTRGVAFVTDAPRLATVLDVEPDWFEADPRAFRDHATLIAPWPTTLAIARVAAKRQPRSVLRWLAVDEAKARRDAIHGRRLRHTTGADPWAITGYEAAAMDAEYGAPVRDILRDWIGLEYVDFKRELAALQAEARRSEELATSALEKLRSLGHKREAASLERQFAREEFDSTGTRVSNACLAGRGHSVEPDHRSSDRLAEWDLPPTIRR